MGDRQNLAAELDFPEAAIQRIQGCLSPKEAASTVVLSKSWYNAWLSRPLLHFDQRYFPSADGFFSYVRRSLERYHRSYLKLESFSLRMNDSSSHNHATEFIARAVILGATDFNLEFSPPVQEYVLPRELLELESLVRLSAVGCTISGLDVLGPQLKTLSLYKVCIGGAMLFPGDWHTIILDCPGLENLILSDCEGFDVVDVARMLTYVYSISVIRVGNRPTSKDIPRISFGPFGFFRLTSLLLERLDTDSMLFSNFSVMFPYVKDLTLRHCDGCLDFRISSTSIHYISLAHTQRLKIRLDAPNLVKFKFSGATSIPELSVVSASRKWESDITLSCRRNLRFMWFLELNEFLLSLSTSKITLDIDLLRVREIERLPNVRPYSKPMVANLMLGGSSLTSDMLGKNT
ncbi:hypothetical protein ACS0TY_014266 [Phlomoides rotata]